MIELTDREKNLLKLLAGLVAVLALYFLIFLPISNLKSGMKSGSEENRNQLLQLESIYQKYSAIKAQKRKFENLLKDTTGPTTFIEQQAQNANILQNKAYSRENPGQTTGSVKKITTNIKFESVDIQSLVNFMYSLESSDRLLAINYLRVSEAIKGSNKYDVVLKIDTFISR